MSAQLEYLANAIAALQKSVNDMSAIKRIEERLAIPSNRGGITLSDFGVKRDFGHKERVEYVPEDSATRAWPVPRDGELAYSQPQVRFPGNE